MAINSVLQTIRNAEIDARSLSEFVSKGAYFTVTRRLAPTIHTLDYYLLVLNNVKEKGDLADIAISDTLGKLEQLGPTVIQRVEAAINNTAVEGGVLADTFVVVDGSLSQRTINKGLESIADLLTINNPKDGLRVYVKSYHVGLGKGGGYFVYSETTPKTEHDGGNVIDASKVEVNLHDESSTSEWLTPVQQGTGCFVREAPFKNTPSNFGVSELNTPEVNAVLLNHIISKVSVLNIDKSIKANSDTFKSSIWVEGDKRAVVGNFTSDVTNTEDLRTVMVAKCKVDAAETQKDVTFLANNAYTAKDGVTNDYPAIQIAGVDGAIVTHNRTYGLCGIKMSYSWNPDLHTRDEIKTYHSIASNNIIRSSDLCYEVFGTGNSVISSSVATGKGREDGQGVRFVAYGRNTSNTNYTPHHQRIVDMQNRGNVINALAIDNLRWGITIQQGIVSNIINSVTIENTDWGMELHPPTTEDHRQEKNIFSSINIRDVKNGVVNNGHSKSLFSDFVISDFDEYALFESPSKPEFFGEYKLNRYSGIITDNNVDSTTSKAVVALNGRSSVYDLTLGDFGENALPAIAKINNSFLRLCASDYTRSSQVIDIQGNNNIIEINIANIPTNFAMVNIVGDNNVITLNLMHQDGVNAGYIEVLGKGNIISGKARLLGKVDASNIINVHNNATADIGMFKYTEGVGVTANRPEFAKVGQSFFDTSINKPVYWTGSAWVDSTGSVV